MEMASTSASLEPCLMQLRPHQKVAVNRCFKMWNSGLRSIAVIHATGTGKTGLAAWIMRKAVERGARSLFLAGRNELITQTCNTLSFVGLHPAVEQGQRFARSDTGLFPGLSRGNTLDPDCVVGSIPSMQRERLNSWPSDYFKLVIIDECHHAVSPSNRAVLEYWSKDCKILGLTATPERADGEDIGQIFQEIAHHYPLLDAVRDHQLVKPIWHCCQLAIEIKEVTSRGKKDLSDSDIAASITPHLTEITLAILKEIPIGSRRTVIFCPDVLTSRLLAEALISRGATAEAVWGECPDRDRILAAYAQGEHQYLCNAMLLTEGWDDRATSAVVILRPTTNWSLLEQMAGRGLRINPGTDKEDCIILDFRWHLAEHRATLNPVELFDSCNLDSEVMVIAKEIVDKGETEDLMMAIEKAEEIHEARQKERIMIEIREKNVRYKKMIYDPMAMMDVLGIPNRPESTERQIEMATPRQIEALAKRGIMGAEKMSKRRCSKILDSLTSRYESNLATPKQVASMIANNVDPKEARAMSFDDARKFLDNLWGTKPSRN